jgi:hypothetical protein
MLGLLAAIQVQTIKDFISVAYQELQNGLLHLIAHKYREVGIVVMMEL